ncbi:MAG: tetratricopeptide repeat protein [Phycisphaerales bacterium]
MSRAREAMLGIVSSLSANMAASPLAKVLAAGVAGGAMKTGDVAQCAAYGALLLGATFWQVCRGQKTEARADGRAARVEKALRRLATDQHEARQELADLALEQQWVREALEKPQASEAFNAAWRGQVEAGLKGLGTGVDEIQATLAQMAVLEFDTNWRVRDVQVIATRTEGKVDAVLTEMQQMKAKVDQFAAQFAASSHLGLLQQLQSENESLKAQIVAVTERYVEAERAKGRPWREAIEALRHDPKKLGEFLDRETEHDERELVEKHRERAAVWYLTGEIDKAFASLTKILALLPNDLDAMNRLGHVAMLRGDLDEAVRLYQRVGELARDDSWRAASYGNLGLIEQTRGNLDAAEAYLKKSLALHEKIGRPEGMANQYGNLGLIERTRGNLEAAEAYHKKSLAINEKLGRLEGMASQYGNLGVIEETRGNLEAAEAYIKKALAINEKLGRQAGMASANGNLGVIAEQRGDKAEARRLWTLSRDLYRRIGAKPTEQLVQGWLEGLG